MKYPNLNEEKKLWRKGHRFVVGLDEAGRGPLAGPVVAGAVVLLDQKIKFKDIKDSKKLSAKKRKEVYDTIKNHPKIEWGIGIVSEKVIDKINILNATKLAMQKALDKIKKIDFLLLDGNFKLNTGILQKSIIKGDEKVLSCSLASIIAKVERDRIMQKYHKKYPQYCFDRHKGYGTKLHMKILKENGPLHIHRKTFAPLSKMVQYQ